MSTRFTCERYPSLVVMGSGGVVARFRDGACVTDDPATVEVLARTPAVAQVGDSAAPAGEPRRRKVTRNDVRDRR